MPILYVLQFKVTFKTYINFGSMSDKRLDWIDSDYHIAEIANVMIEWEPLAPFLELTS